MPILGLFSIKIELDPNTFTFKRDAFVIKQQTSKHDALIVCWNARVPRIVFMGSFLTHSQPDVVSGLLPAHTHTHPHSHTHTHTHTHTYTHTHTHTQTRTHSHTAHIPSVHIRTYMSRAYTVHMYIQSSYSPICFVFYFALLSALLSGLLLCSAYCLTICLALSAERERKREREREREDGEERERARKVEREIERN